MFRETQRPAVCTLETAPSLCCSGLALRLACAVGLTFALLLCVFWGAAGRRGSAAWRLCALPSPCVLVPSRSRQVSPRWEGLLLQASFFWVGAEYNVERGEDAGARGHAFTSCHHRLSSTYCVPRTLRSVFSWILTTVRVGQLLAFLRWRIEAQRG